MAESTYAGKVGALVRFIAALVANAAELPHLEGIRVRIEAILAEAQGVLREQAALVAGKQEASLRLKALLTEGDRLVTAATKVLQEHYGLRSEKLADFHLQPFRGRGRTGKARKPKAEPPPAPATSRGRSAVAPLRGACPPRSPFSAPRRRMPPPRQPAAQLRSILCASRHRRRIAPASPDAGIHAGYAYPPQMSVSSVDAGIQRRCRYPASIRGSSVDTAVSSVDNAIQRGYAVSSVDSRYPAWIPVSSADRLIQRGYRYPAWIRLIQRGYRYPAWITPSSVDSAIQRG